MHHRYPDKRSGEFGLGGKKISICRHGSSEQRLWRRLPLVCDTDCISDCDPYCFPNSPFCYPDISPFGSPDFISDSSPDSPYDFPDPFPDSPDCFPDSFPDSPYCFADSFPDSPYCVPDSGPNFNANSIANFDPE